MNTNYSGDQKGDTENYFKEYAFYCEPDNLDSIRKAGVVVSKRHLQKG